MCPVLAQLVPKIFCTTAGKPLGFRNVATTSFKPLLKSGLPGIRFHDPRHTCATLLLSRGHHPKLVQELLGRASVAMTLDRYNHVLPGMGDQTAAAMEATLSPPLHVVGSSLVSKGESVAIPM